MKRSIIADRKKRIYKPKKRKDRPKEITKEK